MKSFRTDLSVRPEACQGLGNTGGPVLRTKELEALLERNPGVFVPPPECLVNPLDTGHGHGVQDLWLGHNG